MPIVFLCRSWIFVIWIACAAITLGQDIESVSQDGKYAIRYLPGSTADGSPGTFAVYDHRTEQRAYDIKAPFPKSDLPKRKISLISVRVYAWKKTGLEEVKCPPFPRLPSGHVDFNQCSLVQWRSDDLLIKEDLEDWEDDQRARGIAVFRYIDKAGEPLDVISDVEWKLY